MKKIKCDYFQFSCPSECFTTIEVSDDFKTAMDTMNKAGWKKCGGYFNGLKLLYLVGDIFVQCTHKITSFIVKTKLGIKKGVE